MCFTGYACTGSTGSSAYGTQADAGYFHSDPVWLGRTAYGNDDSEIKNEEIVIWDEM
jgi:hypothetical protein